MSKYPDNFIKIYDNAFPDSFCDELIDIFETNHSQNRTYEGRSHGEVEEGVMNPKIKSSWDLDLVPPESIKDPEDALPGIHMDLLSKFPQHLQPLVYDYCNTYIIDRDGKQNYLVSDEDTAEFWCLTQSPKIKRYDPPDGGFHSWHQDWGYFPIMANRMLVMQVFLNDVEEGGETAFFHQDIKIKPEKGKMIIFPPYFTHMHKGHKPISGPKYIINHYIGLNPQLYEPKVADQTAAQGQEEEDIIEMVGRTAAQGQEFGRTSDKTTEKELNALRKQVDLLAEKVSGMEGTEQRIKLRDSTGKKRSYTKGTKKEKGTSDE